MLSLIIMMAFLLLLLIKFTSMYERLSLKERGESYGYDVGAVVVAWNSFMDAQCIKGIHPSSINIAQLDDYLPSAINDYSLFSLSLDTLAPVKLIVNINIYDVFTANSFFQKVYEYSIKNNINLLDASFDQDANLIVLKFQRRDMVAHGKNAKIALNTAIIDNGSWNNALASGC